MLPNNKYNVAFFCHFKFLCSSSVSPAHLNRPRKTFELLLFVTRLTNCYQAFMVRVAHMKYSELLHSVG
jgi:hypothetical protein